MSMPVGRDPWRWCLRCVRGVYRCLVLTGLTCVMPAVGVAVALGGSQFAFSWSARLTAPLVLRALAAAGEVAMTIVWTASALWITFSLAGRPFSQAARRLTQRWLGLRVEAAYQPVPPVIQMATGYWWNGYEYHRSEREARRQARSSSRIRDPQLRRDALWAATAAVTVLPAAALPVLALSGGVYLTLTPGPLIWRHLVWGVVLIVLGLVTSTVGWQALGPVSTRLLGPSPRSRLDQRVQELEAIHADLTQTQVTELERIERGLHDGAQARLVALGMSMGAAEQLVDVDPAAAKAILTEARGASAAALDELRSLVRGINPPVLAERGMVDAIRALALDAPVEVSVRGTVPSRPERPVESAMYFAVAELLANVAKHAHATRVTVELGHAAQTLTATVTDDGVGGAMATAGSGLNGIERRMAAFGGRLEIDSPAGGPTRVTVAVPCVLS